MKLKTITQQINEAKGSKKSPETYHDSQAAALDAATEYAESKGYEVVTDSFWADKVDYGKTVKYHLELKKDGKEQKKMLHISLYRMESGKYELTAYIN